MGLDKVHRRVGVATVVVFLLTGLYMRLRFPGLYDHNQVVRFLFRANHIYLLASGLLNIAVGTYLALQPGGWRRNLQVAGSLLYLAAPALLLVAFFYEPPQARPERYLTVIGVVVLLVATVCHMVGGKKVTVMK
ncbi:MAG: hypothetical protein IH804_05005 [Planctomycetes bacterium]|nr:hypothetical protein [Planctomycetota bacterium]